MRINHQMHPALIRKYGTEVPDLADKTWPLVIPDSMRLIAILNATPSADFPSLDIALDVTEPNRYERYIGQLLNGKWTSIRMFYLPEHLTDYCRLQHDP